MLTTTQNENQNIFLFTTPGLEQVPTGEKKTRLY